MCVMLDEKNEPVTIAGKMRWLFTMTGLLLVLLSQAQDTRFSQYYKAPLYLNPAFTGATGVARVGANIRNQGTGSQHSYTTLAAYGDFYWEDYFVSGGLLFISEQDESSGFSRTTVGLPLSYDFSINKNVTFKPALQASYTRQAIDYNRFLFSDQINNDGSISGGSSEPLAVSNQLYYFDLAGGILVFSERWWIGYAMHNLMQNNISYVIGESNDMSIRYSAHGGIKLDMNGRKISERDKTLMPTFSFVSQGPYNLLDAGLLASIEPIMFGAMYRGVPNPLYSGDYSAISWIVGLEMHDFSFGYSYDMPLGSSIMPGGTHEISLSFLWDPTNPHATPRSMKRLKCPLPY